MIQALPSIVDPQSESALSYMNAYYAAMVSALLLERKPEIRTAIELWNEQNANLSKLEMNQELKNVLLTETPWVQQAISETERMRGLEKVFDKNYLNYSLNRYLIQLQQLQLSDGSWPWYKGMEGSEYITMRIAYSMKKIEKMPFDRVAQWNSLFSNAMNYLNVEMTDNYFELKESSGFGRNKDYLSHHIITYLYLLESGFEGNDDRQKEAIDFYRYQLKTHIFKKSLKTQALGALVLFDLGEDEFEDLIKSFTERSLYSNELGRYWKANDIEYDVRGALECQSLLIQAFTLAKKPNRFIDGLKVWLLKQKQVQGWGPADATLDACTAFMMSGNDWLNEKEGIQIFINGKKLEAENPLYKIGYYKLDLNKSDLARGMKVEVKSKKKGLSWGAVYWQYYEDMHQVQSFKTALQIKRKLYKEDQDEEGVILKPISKDLLYKGNKLYTRITVETDRSMDYVHIHDSRSAAMEPIGNLSGPEFSAGLYYYKDVKDASVHFYLYHLPKGIHTFEYSVRIVREGYFTHGYTNIQSYYAPEFGGHTEGNAIRVVEN